MIKTNYKSNKHVHVDHRVTIVRNPSYQDYSDEEFIGRTGIILNPSPYYDDLLYLVWIEGYPEDFIKSFHWEELFKISL